MTVRIEIPYIYYHDADGNALDDGKIIFWSAKPRPSELPS